MLLLLFFPFVKKSILKFGSLLKKRLDSCFESGDEGCNWKKYGDLIRSEVNIKEIEYLAADNEFIHKKIKPNFVLLGKKLGQK